MYTWNRNPKIGEKVICCFDNISYLNNGGIYTIKEVKALGDRLQVSVEERKGFYFLSRFKPNEN